MDIKKLQSLVIDALEDVKAQDILVYDTTHLTSLFDRIAIASGTSNRQTKALAASVRDKVKENGGHIISIEGEETGEWVLVDLGDMIVHIMQPAIRAYYRLEEIWGDKEIKLGAAKRVSRRTASEPEAEAAPARKVGRHLAATQAADDTPPKKPAARKTAAKTAVKTAAGTAVKAVAKAPARKTAAAKSSAAKTPVGKTVKVTPAKSTAVKKAPAKRAAAKTRAS
jgi:ribosome-associated protein